MIKLVQFSFEGLLILGLFLFMYVQLLRPLMRRTPVFPMFRKRPNLEREMEEVTEAAEDNAQQKALDRKKRKLGVVNTARPTGNPGQHNS